jgi:hypothetical protein
MKRSKNSKKQKKLGVSYTISAVIMTATAISLTLVAWSYANQTLETQRGSTEFDVIMDSMLAFNDAFGNIAWKPLSARTSRFILEYGYLELFSNVKYSVNITDSEFQGVNHTGTTGYLEYSLKTKYKSFEDGYLKTYLGNEDLISDGAGSYAKGSVSQAHGFISMNLSYGFKAMQSSAIISSQNGAIVNYVDIWVIEFKTTGQLIVSTEFDLNAKCLDVVTYTEAGPSGEGFTIPEGKTNCTLSVQQGEVQDQINIDLNGDKVVFNFIVATVQVNP